MNDHVRQGLLEAVASSSVPEIAQATCHLVSDSSTVLCRIWVIDQSQRLRLVASSGNPLGGGSYTRIDGGFSAIEPGVGKIGRIAATREALVASRIRGDEGWLENPAWIARQGIRAFAAFPLVATDRVLGVLATFNRCVLTDDALDELRFAAEIAAAGLHRLQGLPAEKTRAPLSSTPSIVTRAELRALEKRSIQAALARTSGKVFGADGAAALLEMKPTTLLSRLKALDVTPP